jgi:RNA-directed DNA polymerase
VGPAPADPSLWAQLLAPATLQRAWERVAANGGAPGADGVRVEDFAAAWPQHLAALQADLARGTYRPLPPKTFTVPKRSGGVRQLSIPTLRDRLVQQALTLVLTPLFEPHFAPCSFAYRPGRSAHHALKQVEDYLRRGRRWVLDADIASFFDTVDLAVLRGLLRRRITDERILALIAQDLEVGARRPGVGIAQGSATSPLWANVYLDVFDGALLDAGQALVRYADDFVVLAESREQAEAALALTQAVLWEPLRLRLNPDKTRIASLQEGFVFLGFHFSPAGRRPCDEAWESLHEQMQHCAAHTPAPALGERLRRLVQGWRGYFGTPEEEIWQREGIAPMFTANETSDRVQKLLDGCRVLRYLAEKPQRTHHLNHTERLVLLYTFGRLGAEGEAFLHRVLQPCANYSPQTTQKWINRLEPGHPPLSCARLRDWLGDLGPDFPCDCFPNLPRGVYPSPVRWAQPEAPRPEPVEVLRWGPAEGEGGDWKLEMGDGKVENGRAAPLGRPAAAEPEGTEDGEVEAPGRAAPLGRPAVAGEPEGTEDGEWGETLWREVAEDLFAEPEAIQVGEGT